MRRLPLLVALASALAVTTAGCRPGAEETVSGAEIAPADTAVFVSVNTDFDSEQWETAEALVDKFPGGGELVRRALEEGEREAELDFERDLKPALGPEVDVVLLEVGEEEAEDAVVLTQPRDRDRYVELLEREDTPWEEVDGWIASADEQQALDAFLAARGGDSLAESERFREAMEGLDEHALATVYVNGEKARAALEESDLGPLTGICSLGGDVVSAAASLRAEEDGVHFAVTSNEEGGEEPEEYEAEFVDDLPAGALAYLSFNDAERQFAAVRNDIGEAAPEFDAAVAQIERFLGVSLEEDVLPLFRGEGALAVYRGSPIPTVTLVLKVDDEEEAMSSVDTLVSRIADVTGGREPRETEIAGVRAKVAPMGFFFSLVYATFDGKLVVTTTEAGIEGLRDDESKLGDDERFANAREAADMPDETAGFVYVDLEAAVRFADDAAAFADEEIPAEVRGNLEPLRSLLFYSSADEVCSAGFIAID